MSGVDPALRKKVEDAVGGTDEWELEPTRFQFRTRNPVTLHAIVALSVALDTDAINFYFGDEGSPGYSELTPGTEATPGYIEVMVAPSSLATTAKKAP